MNQLTRQQSKLIEFIALFAREKGYAPSYDEMAAAIGLKSKSGIAGLMLALERHGYIRRIPRLARAIEVIQSPTPTLTSYERVQQLIGAINSKPPAAVTRVAMTNLKLVSTAAAHASGHSLGGEVTGMTPATKGSRPGRRA